jgi:hypothetical protein
VSGGLPARTLQPDSAVTDDHPAQHLQAGLWWPAADPGKLRSAAAVWRDLAAEMDTVSGATSAVVKGVATQNQGQAIAALETYWESRWVGGGGALPSVVEGARALAEGLDRYAAAVEKARARIEELIAAAVTAAVIGVGLTVLTIGISDVAAGAVAAGLIAAAAAVGVELSAEVAAILAGVAVLAGAGALEGGLSDLAIQEERIAYFHDQGSLSWNETLQYSAVGAATAGLTFGGGTAIAAGVPAVGRIAGRLGGAATPTDTVGTADGIGAMRRLVYEASPKHGSVAKGNVSPAPVNGQQALDNSIQVKVTSWRRVGIDYEERQFVVFDPTRDGIFHGHIRSWTQLDQQQRNALIRDGMADRRGRIL